MADSLYRRRSFQPSAQLVGPLESLLQLPGPQVIPQVFQGLCQGGESSRQIIRVRQADISPHSISAFGQPRGIPQPSGGKLQIDPIAFVKTLSDPTDPNVIVNETSQFLFAMTPTATQIAFLKETLLPGLPDYEWTTEWAAYLSDPTNATKISAVRNKLQALLALMMEMPEYQLS